MEGEVNRRTKEEKKQDKGREKLSSLRTDSERTEEREREKVERERERPNNACRAKLG